MTHFVRDDNPGARNVYIACYRCGKRLLLSNAYIDIEGPAFQAYYDKDCAEIKLLLDQETEDRG